VQSPRARSQTAARSSREQRDGGSQLRLLWRARWPGVASAAWRRGVARWSCLSPSRRSGPAQHGRLDGGRCRRGRRGLCQPRERGQPREQAPPGAAPRAVGELGARAANASASSRKQGPGAVAAGSLGPWLVPPSAASSPRPSTASRASPALAHPSLLRRLLPLSSKQSSLPAL